MPIENLKTQYQKKIIQLKKELLGLNTGRANSALVENIEIIAYGTRAPLKSLAQISIPETKQITIEPYDKNIIKDIEKGIAQADLDFTSEIDGSLIRIKIPDLTEERRKKLVKVLRDRLEKTRVMLRQERDKTKKEIESKEKKNEISEDEKFKMIEELDQLTSEYMQKIKGIGERKEKEIMTV